jgi:hypothetical protein
MTVSQYVHHIDPASNWYDPRVGASDDCLDIDLIDDQYIVYLFEKLILCCKEKNYSAEELAARGLRAPTQSTLDIDKMMKDVLSQNPRSDPEKLEDKSEEIPEEKMEEKPEEEPKEQPEEENDPYLFLQGRIFGNSITDIMNFTTEGIPPCYPLINLIRWADLSVEAYVVEIFWTSDDEKDHYFSMHFEYREDMESWTEALVAMNEMNPTPAQEQADKIVREKSTKPPAI